MTDAPRDRARPPPGTPSPTGVLLRSLLFLTGQYVSLLLFAPFAFLTFPLPLATRYRAVSQFARFNLWWLEKTCGLGFEVEGREHILSTPGIVMAKHQSAWETIALQVLFRPQTWVMKRELLFGGATEPISGSMKSLLCAELWFLGRNGAINIVQTLQNLFI